MQEGKCSLVDDYSISSIREMSTNVHISQYCLLLVSMWRSLFLQVHAIMIFNILRQQTLLFFYAQYMSSSLALNSRNILSDMDNSIKQPSTTITKLYSNNTSWAAISLCTLESVLDVFMLTRVTYSIAAAERTWSALLFSFLITMSLYNCSNSPYSLI